MFLNKIQFSPYSFESIYTSSICVGIAKEFVGSEDYKLMHTNEVL